MNKADMPKHTVEELCERWDVVNALIVQDRLPAGAPINNARAELKQLEVALRGRDYKAYNLWMAALERVNDFAVWNPKNYYKADFQAAIDKQSMKDRIEMVGMRYDKRQGQLKDTRTMDGKGKLTDTRKP